MYFSQATDYSCFIRLDRTIRKLDTRYGAGVASALPKFGRVYYEVKYRLNRSNLIPHFCYDASLEEKREILASFGVDVGSHDESWIERVFTQRIRRLCRQLDHDVGGVS